MIRAAAVAPLLAAAFGRHQVKVTDAMVLHYNGAAITFLLAGLLAAGIGALSYRQMDDRRGVPLVADVLAAYRNECAHEGLPLDEAIIDTSNGTLTCPWHGFCFDAASGECLSAPGAQLEQLPMRVDGGEVWIRIET